MDNYSLILLVTLAFLILTLVFLAQLFRNLIRKQIEDKMKDMIPLKSIRDRIGIRIKLRR